MKIGTMTLWNAANGPSIHAELIGREWVKLGHMLTVFSSIDHPDAIPTSQKDEDYVIRNFSAGQVVPVTRASYFDPKPLIKEDYEVFVAQNVERLPANALLDIFPRIKEKAITVMIVHEGRPSVDPLYFKFSWDAIVCFDNRYVLFLSKYFPKEIISIIPYPCHPIKLGNKEEARKKLNLPLNKKIVFSYGFNLKSITPVLHSIEELSNQIPLTYVIVANPAQDIVKVKRTLGIYEFVDIRISALPIEELYDYLHASNALLIHKEPSEKYSAVISSSICSTLGSGCPILSLDSKYVEMHGDEITKYKDMNDLKRKLLKIFEDKNEIEKIKTFLRNRSVEVIAALYIKLFKEKIRSKKR